MDPSISYLSPLSSQVKERDLEHRPLDAHERRAVDEAIQAGRVIRIYQGEVEAIERWRSTHRNARQWAYQGVR